MGGAPPFPWQQGELGLTRRWFWWSCPLSLCCLQLVSFGGRLVSSVVYDVAPDNRDQTLPVLTDVIMQVS